MGGECGGRCVGLGALDCDEEAGEGGACGREGGGGGCVRGERWTSVPESGKRRKECSGSLRMMDRCRWQRNVTYLLSADNPHSTPHSHSAEHAATVPQFLRVRWLLCRSICRLSGRCRIVLVATYGTGRYGAVERNPRGGQFRVIVTGDLASGKTNR